MHQSAVKLSLSDSLWAWFETNKKQVAWSAGIIAVVAFFGSYYFWRQGERQSEASLALSRVETGSELSDGKRGAPPEAYLKVAADYPATEAGGRALLLAGTTLFERGKYAEAQSQFERFCRDYPESPFLPQARLGVASSLYAQGKVEEAVPAYEIVVNRYADSVAEPQAQFTLASIYESQGKLEQAWSLFEKLAQSDLNSSIGSEAGMRSEELKVKLPGSSSLTNLVTNVVRPVSVSNSAAVTQPTNPKP
jgi:predicted negative regulator of RcsB-dependent stress response